jgi:hypothetical protein
MQLEGLAPNAPRVAFYQPDPDYRRTEGLSQSAMKELLKSPAHYMSAYGPNAEPRFATAAMTWGLALHARVLEPEKFDNLFYDRSSKAKEPTVQELKDMLDESQVEYPKSAKKADLELLLWPEGKKKDSRTSMDPNDFGNVIRAAETLRTHDITGEWFCPGNEGYREFNEVSAYIKNENGQTLKGRFDRLLLDEAGKKVTILDLKTTQSAELRDFQKSCVNFSYDLQAAWYSHLAERCWPGFEVEFLFCAIEKKPPFGISVFRASENLVRNGRKKMAKALDLFAQCQALDYWPSYDPIVHDLDLPAWGLYSQEEQSF